MPKLTAKFRDDFSKAMYDLGIINNTLEWWAMNFTNRSPVLTGLFNNVFARKRMSKPRPTCFFICYTLMKLLFRKFSYAFMLKTCPKLAGGKKYLLATLFLDNSFKKTGFSDVFLEGLREYLNGNKIENITAGVVMCKFHKLMFNKDRDVFSFEKFVGYSDIFKLFVASLKCYFFGYKVNGKLIIDGEDYTDYVGDEIKVSVSSGQLMINLMVYHAAKNIVKKYDFEKIIFPFENRAFEKMIILGARASKPGIKIVGYQHAAITAKHLNYYLVGGESKVIPFPDEVITMGQVTYGILINHFNFPPDKLRVGCALRQNFKIDTGMRKFSGKIKRILVVFALDFMEYARILKFLDKGFRDPNRYEFAFRLHPSGGKARFNKAINVYRPQNLNYIFDGQDLNESLEKTDAVIYMSSTIPIEALYRGIPVIHIDDSKDELTYDTLFCESTLKWECNNPDNLFEALKTIEDMDKDKFNGAQIKAREFAKNYCVPKEGKNKEVFLK